MCLEIDSHRCRSDVHVGDASAEAALAQEGDQRCRVGGVASEHDEALTAPGPAPPERVALSALEALMAGRARHRELSDRASASRCWCSTVWPATSKAGTSVASTTWSALLATLVLPDHMRCVCRYAVVVMWTAVAAERTLGRFAGRLTPRVLARAAARAPGWYLGQAGVVWFE